MATRDTTLGVSRRELLKTGLAAGATLSAWSLYSPRPLRGQEVGSPKRGVLYVCADGILCTSIRISRGTSRRIQR